MQKILREIKNFLQDKIKQNYIVALSIGILIFFVLLIASLAIFHSKNTGGGVVLSKNTIDDLVEKAANQKYLQKVFNAPDSLKKLPMPKTSSEFKPLPEDMRSISGDKSREILARCIYKGQSYVAGDIVKTDGGWVRCTPTIVFVEVEDKEKGTSLVRQAGSSAWTAVQ